LRDYALRSQTAIERPIVLKLIIHKLRPGSDFLLRYNFLGCFFGGVSLGRLILLLFAGFLIVVIIVTVELQFFLDFRNQRRNFMQGDFVFFEDVGVFAVELPRCLFGVWIQDHLLEQDGVDLLLCVAGALLVVDADDRRLEPDAEPEVNDPVIAHNSNLE